jgi:LPS-assembly protein
MLFAAADKPFAAQQMTTQAPQSGVRPTAPEQVQSNQLPNDSAQVAYPTAVAVPAPTAPDAVVFESKQQDYQGGVYKLDKDVVVTYKDRRAEADHVEYDSNTGDLTMTGHVLVSGGANHEIIHASHGAYNLRTATGRFYDVDGSVGIQATPNQRRTVYTTDSPFLFTGKTLVKTGPEVYDLYYGTVTSCQLPNPDWLFSADHISLEDNIARAHNSVFHLLNFPILFFPYVTHPDDPSARQSGFMIPTPGLSSTKGIVLGEQFFLVINRSTDLTVGAEYYSSIGWAQNATLRYKGSGYDFLKLHYSGVLDRRAQPDNQGGEEAVLAARHDFSTESRAAANIDYLSSYVYREAFSDNYNQAVTSDIVSTAYVTRELDGLEFAALADRYQGIKVVGTTTTPQQEVHIFHAPTLSLNTTGHVVPGTANALSTGLEVSLDTSGSGLKRTQPNFETGGILERFDFRPQASYPIAIGNWHIIPSIESEETYYTRSRAKGIPGQPPQQSETGMLRSDFEFALSIRPPVIERTFQPSHFQKFLGTEFRHTIEPELTYRLADGIDDFSRILRFDATDVVSNTNEVEYGATQRIFRRPKPHAANSDGTPRPCATDQLAQAPGFSSDAPNAEDDMPEQPEEDAPVSGRCPSEELISWRLTQKYFFDETFGGAVVNGRRNIFATTLDLTGVAFLTEPREISPIVSRLRLRSSAHTDIEWDFDLDPATLKFNSSNVFLDLHQGNAFGAFSYARLDAPGRFETENPTPTAGQASSNGVTSSVSDFNQLRMLLGYGSPTKPGLSIAGNAGIDLKALYGATKNQTITMNGVTTTSTLTVYPPLLQYATVQASYNWNCCGLAIEYRKFELGSVRNEGTYRFNFTLANIGAAGNLRRAERLF